MTNPSPAEQTGDELTDTESLSQPRRELLALAAEVFKEFHPKPGTLHDLPQLTVEPEDMAQVCRLAKEDPRLAVKQLLCLACVDHQEYFELV